MKKWKLIYTATSDDVIDKFGQPLTYTDIAEANADATAISKDIYLNRPNDFAPGGYLIGTNYPIVKAELDSEY